MINIHLRDINTDLIYAWRNKFKNMQKTKNYNICISEGDAFDYDHKIDAFVSPANSFGHMYGGVDKYIIDYFGKSLATNVYDKISEKYPADKKMPVGEAVIVKINKKTKLGCNYLISAPTMDSPGKNISNTKNAYYAFNAIITTVEKFNKTNPSNKINSILCTGLGTAVGQLCVKKCAKQMYDAIYYKDKNIKHALCVRNEFIKSSEFYDRLYKTYIYHDNKYTNYKLLIDDMYDKIKYASHHLCDTHHEEYSFWMIGAHVMQIFIDMFNIITQFEHHHQHGKILENHFLTEDADDDESDYYHDKHIQHPLFTVCFQDFPELCLQIGLKNEPTRHIYDEHKVLIDSAILAMYDKYDKYDK